MIAVVDYGSGNLFSIGQALRHLGAAYEITADADHIAAAERVILPGVGAFGHAMDGLRSRGLVDPVRAVAQGGTPLLGICVGMQLLADRSEEFGRHDGLGLIPGTVRRLPEGGDAKDAVRIPNVGWRSLSVAPGDSLLAGTPPGSMVYFLHSFAPEPDEPRHVAATIDVNGANVAAIIRKDNVVGYQFHPEKSGEVGLGLLDRFLRLATDARRSAARMAG